MTLFRLGAFTSAAGLQLDWKIECEALTDEDWACIAKVSLPLIGPFGSVMGVPRGGVPLAAALRPYADRHSATLLVVDDVWTTGKSLIAYTKALADEPGDWKGFVVFARGTLLDNVTCFMRATVARPPCPIP